MKCVIEGALAIDAKQPPAGTYDDVPAVSRGAPRERAAA